MGDTRDSGKGNRVSIDSKGNKTSTPITAEDVQARMEANSRPFGADFAVSATDATIGRMQRMPNRRNAEIEKAVGHKKGGSVGRGDGAAQRGKTRGKMC